MNLKRSTLYLLAALGGLTLLTCTPKTNPVTPSSTPRIESPESIPTEVQKHLDLMISVGREIYIQDKASAIGTDVLIANEKNFMSKGIGGYITLREGNEDGTPSLTWQIFFFSQKEPYQILYRIRVFFAKGDNPPEFQPLDPPEIAKPYEVALIRARNRAVQAMRLNFGEPESPVNTIFIPGETFDKTGFAIYLLAATTNSDHMVFGPHYKALISYDGSTLLDMEQITDKGVITIPGKEEPAIAVHKRDNWPVETHVFASLFYKRPIYVAASSGAWVVTEDEILWLQKGWPEE